MTRCEHRSRSLMVAVLAGSLTVSALTTPPGFAAQTHPSAHRQLKQWVEERRAAAELVGLGAVAIHQGRLIGPVVSGEREHQSGVPLAVGDRWHIGSVTKSFTSTMIARLVEDDLLAFETTVAEVFTDAETIHPQWRGVTLHQLLTHSSGAPANFSPWIIFKQPRAGAPRTRARASAVRKLLAKAPEAEPGSRFKYSNAGYAIAAAMAETRTGLSWETLMQRYVFGPLELQSAGFGPPDAGGGEKLSQPQGHADLLMLKFAAMFISDNSPIIWPAGAVHLSLEDLARFGYDHLQGELGRGQLLNTTSYQFLHRPVLKNYASGWVTSPAKGLATEPVLWHNGSNRFWYTLLVIMPADDIVIAVASNDGDIVRAEAGAWRIVQQMTELLQKQVAGQLPR